MQARSEPWQPEQVRARVDEVAAVYAGAFAGPPYFRTACHARDFAATCCDQLARPGYRFQAAVAGDGRLVGFAYGFTGGQGQWWTDAVAASMPVAARARWLTDHFELAELAVHPAAQGQGLGRRLHDALLARVPNPTACLSTIAVETVALSMYRRSGWLSLLDPFHFPGISEPYIIMGLELAARRTGPR